MSLLYAAAYAMILSDVYDAAIAARLLSPLFFAAICFTLFADAYAGALFATRYAFCFSRFFDILRHYAMLFTRPSRLFIIFAMLIRRRCFFDCRLYCFRRLTLRLRHCFIRCCHFHMPVQAVSC